MVWPRYFPWDDIDLLGSGPSDGWNQFNPFTPAYNVLDGRNWTTNSGFNTTALLRSAPFDLSLHIIHRVSWTAIAPAIPPTINPPNACNGHSVNTGWIGVGYECSTGGGDGTNVPGPRYNWSLGSFPNNGFIYPTAPTHRFEMIYQVGPVKSIFQGSGVCLETRQVGKFLYVDGTLVDSYNYDTSFDAINHADHCSAKVRVQQTRFPPTPDIWPNHCHISEVKFRVE